MYSMTGYGKAEYAEKGINLTVEIKTVNNRVLDFNVKAPRIFAAVEDKIRNVVAEHVKRGRIDIFVNFYDRRDNASKMLPDLNRAAEYYAAAKSIAEKLGVENDVTPSFLLKCPDVLEESSGTDIEELIPVIEQTVKNACEKLNEMRKAEGEKLAEDMLRRMETIKTLRDKIALRAPNVAEDYKVKLKARIEEALKDVKYDEARLLNEVAFYTDKVNIDEELTRLGSHIEQFKKVICADGVGKKLDFLMQEFNRETNTICSKSNDIEVTGFALELKNEIEKVREQVQNLE